MSVWCLEGVWEESRGCLEVVWRVSGKGLEFFWMRSWRCLVTSSGRENVDEGSHHLFVKCTCRPPTHHPTVYLKFGNIIF